MITTSMETCKPFNSERQKHHTYIMPYTSINESSDLKPIIIIQNIVTVDNLSEHATTAKKGQSTWSLKQYRSSRSPDLTTAVVWAGTEAQKDGLESMDAMVADSSRSNRYPIDQKP